jgi:hypothetical protein
VGRIISSFSAAIMVRPGQGYGCWPRPWVGRLGTRAPLFSPQITHIPLNHRYPDAAPTLAGACESPRKMGIPPALLPAILMSHWGNTFNTAGLMSSEYPYLDKGPCYR